MREIVEPLPPHPGEPDGILGVCRTVQIGSRHYACAVRTKATIEADARRQAKQALDMWERDIRGEHTQGVQEQ